MIDPATGRILLPLPGLQVGPALTRDAFLASEVVKDCLMIACDEARCLARLPTVQFEGHEFDWAVDFRGSALTTVHIGSTLPEGPEAEKFVVDPKENSDLTLSRFHDFLLERALGRQRSFAWGDVSSSYDPKGNGTSITVQYPATRGAMMVRRGCLGALSMFFKPE